MSLGIACENIAHPHYLPHKIFTRKLRPPITSRTTTKPMNFPVQKEPHPRFGHRFVLHTGPEVRFLIVRNIVSTQSILSNVGGG